MSDWKFCEEADEYRLYTRTTCWIVKQVYQFGDSDWRLYATDSDGYYHLINHGFDSPQAAMEKQSRIRGPVIL